MAHRGCVQGRTRVDRVYGGSVQWHTSDVQGMAMKTQVVTGEDRVFSYGHGFLEPVVLGISARHLYSIAYISDFIFTIAVSISQCKASLCLLKAVLNFMEVLFRSASVTWILDTICWYLG